MRTGINPQKSKLLQSPDFFHQVIMPVYIPNNEDYFEDSFNILKISVDSLLKTCHSKTFFSIVNNGSCKEVEDYLDALFKSGSIHELIHTSNIGKVNAVNKALVGQAFPLITISDSDVLFLNHWQKSVYEVYTNFPKTVAVCTTPNSRTLKTLTENIYFDCLFSKSLRFTEVKDSKAMIDFVKSIGNDNFFRAIHLKKNLTVNRNGISALVGAGHYVCTYRNDALHTNFEFTNKLLGRKAMDSIDLEIVKKGYWRLSTEFNFTYHMGNFTEDWMYEKLNDLVEENQDIAKPELATFKSSPLMNWFKLNIFGSLLFSRHIFWKSFLCFIGLIKEEAKDY